MKKFSTLTDIRILMRSNVPCGTFMEQRIIKFVEEYKEVDLRQYAEILEEYGLRWDDDSMRNADVSKLDARAILALIVGVFRADHFAEGILGEYCKNGIMIKWLDRLDELDYE